MSELRKAAKILRKTAECLENDKPINISLPPSVASTSSRPVTTMTEVRFYPYSRPNSSTNNRTGSTGQPKWSHRFFCLSSTDQKTKPDSHLKRELHEAGLGEKKISLQKNDDPVYFKQEMLSNFPKLADGGGFTLSRITNRTHLKLITPPPQGYTTNFLTQLYMGSCIIYVRPLQRNLSTEKSQTEECDLYPTEHCMECGQLVSIVDMRNHIREEHEDVKVHPSIIQRESLVPTAFCPPRSFKSGLKCYPVRIHPGQELRQSLLDIVKREGLKAAFVLTCVGSVTQARLRMANADKHHDLTGPFEIVSLVGTLSGGEGGHLHISLSDKEGKMIGGHVIGNLNVFTTAEVVIGECEDAVFTREIDDQTTYDELVIKQRN